MVTKGFQEGEKPQSNQPTMVCESLNIYFAVASNEGLNIRSLDIRAAFSQARELDREVYMKPPIDIKKKGKIWKLKKPLYGLNDAFIKFWLKVREVFNEDSLKILKGDEAFYYWHDAERNLDGMVSSHVDDFILDGTEKNMAEITLKIKEKLEISKLEYDEFRFTGMDVRRECDRIVVSMEEYVRSLEMIEVKKGSPRETLTDVEMKVYRKYVGNLTWLASNMRPDLAVYVMESARKQKNTMLKDFRNINRILEKVKGKENKVIFSRMAELQSDRGED